MDRIRIVVPTDLSNLSYEEGKDYCTLVTCTPYGVNTHRLLVRGHRVANSNGEANVVADAVMIDPDQAAPFVAVPILAALFVWIMVWPKTSVSSKKTSGKRRRKRNHKGELEHDESNERK